MKKTSIIIAFFLAAFVIQSFKEIPPAGDQKPAGKTVDAVTIPDSVMVVMQKACIGCHADGANAMARGKLNFTQWAKYDAEKQLDKADDICDEMKKGSMPPKGFKKKYPDKIPTQAEVDKVCNWVSTLKK